MMGKVFTIPGPVLNYGGPNIGGAQFMLIPPLKNPGCPICDVDMSHARSGEDALDTTLCWPLPRGASSLSLSLSLRVWRRRGNKVNETPLPHQLLSYCAPSLPRSLSRSVDSFLLLKWPLGIIPPWPRCLSHRRRAFNLAPNGTGFCIWRVRWSQFVSLKVWVGGWVVF